MFTLWSFFLKKTQFTVLLAIALAAFGFASLAQMPKESTPEIELPLAIIVTALPGANATDVEKLVTNELEDPIKNNLDHIKTLSSKSSSGVSSISVEFATEADITESINNIKDEVDKVKNNLPKDATEPQIIKIDFAKEPVITFAVAADVPRGILLDISERLEYELEQVSGVSSVSISGVQEREVHVLVKKEALANYNLSLTDISRAISAQNIALPTGNIDIEGTRYPVRFEGDIQSTEDISRLPIAAPGGIPLTVGDVATVIDGFTDASALSRLSINGNPSRNSFTVDVFKKPTAQLTDVGELTKAKLAALSTDGQLLDGIVTSITFDRAEMLASDLSILGTSGLITVLLVMSVLFFAIGGREALVAGLAIPLSFLTAFIGLKWSGNSLNFVSLFALILSTGIIVDSSIVVVEGINAHMRNDDREQSKARAAFKALKEYYTPLTSGTLTTVAVFAPLFTISGVTGEFIAAIPFTIIFVLLASLFVALAIIPLFASLVLKRTPAVTSLSLKRDRALGAMTNYYEQFLRSFLTDRRNSNTMFGVIIVFFILALSLPISGSVRTIFFPSENSEYVFVETELSSGAVLSNTDLELRKVEEAIYDVPGIVSFSVTAGKSSPYSNVFEGVRSDPKLGNILMTIDVGTGYTSAAMVETLRERLSSITSSDILVGQMEEGPPVGSPITITFSGSDLDDLDIVANATALLLEQIPGASGVSATTKDNAVEFVLNIDRHKSISSGVTPLSVALNINTALAGTEATTIKLFGTDIPVTLRMDLSGKETLSQSNNTTIDSLRYLPVGNQALLGSFVDTQLTQSRTAIRHEDGKRITVVTSNIAPGANARIVTEEFKKIAKDNLTIPKGVTMAIGGENEEVDQSFTDMFTALIMGMVAMFAILVIQFNSARQTVYVLLTVPLSLIGVFTGLLIMDKPLSFPSIMGFIALAGIVVNNGIILIDVINRKRTEYQDEDLLEAIVDGASSRLRPVLLTAITTVVGILPLVFAAELWAPLAYSIVFGLTFATILTLVLLPAIYYRWPGTQR